MPRLRPVVLFTLAAIAPAHPGFAMPAGAGLRADPGPLTPVGAERGGNASGTIPPWSPGEAPKAGEAPLYTVTAANAGQYRPFLPEGLQALFKAFPDWRMQVFPSHRIAAAPASVYAAIGLNAERARPAPSGIEYGVAGAAGGIPFPHPQTGAEAIWNHLLAWWGLAREAHVGTWIATADGTIQQTAGYRETTDYPYYQQSSTPDFYFKTRRVQDTPPARAGEAYIAWQPMDASENKYVAWRYLPGEHRVRKAPSLSYDTPDPDASGYEELDDYYLFFGAPDRYIWRLAGKRDMLVPYNNDALNHTPPRRVMGPRHPDPGLIRYEMHRVWIVEGSLAPGKHHVAPRRRLYLDEDTWLAVYSEAWDEDGHLWKFSQATMMTLPEVPATIIGGQFIYDLLQGGYVYDFALGGPGDFIRATRPHADSVYDPSTLTAESMR